MAKRVPKQMVLGFTPQDDVVNKRIRQKAMGLKVTNGPGRKRVGSADKITHDARPRLAPRTAVHVTMKCLHGVPSLRSKPYFKVVREAFRKFKDSDGFRVVHFAILSNHMHVLVEADSKEQLSKGMQRLAHSMSRRINAALVHAAGGRVSTKSGPYSLLPGWFGEIFNERYHAHVLRSHAEIANALNYVIHNQAHHQGMPLNSKTVRTAKIDFASSRAWDAAGYISQPHGLVLFRACQRLDAR